MNRRKFLKIAGGLPFIGFIPQGKAESGHFWMHTYGPLYDPKEIDPNWIAATSSLLGVYSGEVLLGVKASKHPLGTLIVLNDGRHYFCFELNEHTYIKNNGVFLK